MSDDFYSFLSYCFNSFCIVKTVFKLGSCFAVITKMLLGSCFAVMITIENYNTHNKQPWKTNESENSMKLATSKKASENKDNMNKEFSSWSIFILQYFNRSI